MTSNKRSFRKFRNPIGCLILLAAFAAAAGCSTAETTGGSGTNVNHILPSGSSVSGWLATPSGGTHASTATLDYIAGNGSSGCAQCHGSDLSGGISGVSCFGNPAGCHHDPVANWTSPTVHGATAKKAPGSSGFASCQICHAANFSGGGAQDPCSRCHVVNAPHPQAPWRSSTGSTHTNTDTANATVCAQCHYPGSPNNPANHPATPAPAGTAPGCFNSTLCHAEGGAPHPLGNPAWYATPPASQPHGNAAKATPSSTAGFAYCKVCHGTGNTFTGGAAVSCYPCHGNVGTPHPSQWRTGDTYVHTTTATGNATVCAFCHTAGLNSPIAPPPAPAPGAQPDCFNNTLCHGAGGAPHPVGATWVTTAPAAQPHGNSAKATPGSTAGFDYCKVCHGTGTTPPANFGGGVAGVSCTNTAGCHGAAVASPHPSQWNSTDTYKHNSTDPGNAPVCAQCHRNSNPGTPNCFNNTLCHGTVSAHNVPYNEASHYAVTSATFPGNCSICHDISSPSTKAGPVCQTCHVAASPLAAPGTCTSCHASPPDNTAPAGAVYPNIAGAHAGHLALNSAGSPVSCNTCHNGLGPSLLDNNHYNRAKSRVPPGDVLFNTSYLAESGTRSFDNVSTSPTYLTCNAVSCHGGQRTPNWQTLALVGGGQWQGVNNACTSCHQSGTSQFNSYNSGEHTSHLDLFGTFSSSCTLCHNTATLAVNHFTTLADNTISQAVAAATVGGGTTRITTYVISTGTCTPSAGAGCHGTRDWSGN